MPPKRRFYALAVNAAATTSGTHHSLRSLDIAQSHPGQVAELSTLRTCMSMRCKSYLFTDP